MPERLEAVNKADAVVGTGGDDQTTGTGKVEIGLKKAVNKRLTKHKTTSILCTCTIEY